MPKPTYGSLGQGQYTKESSPQGGYYQAPNQGVGPYDSQAKATTQGQSMQFRQPQDHSPVLEQKAKDNNAAIEADRAAFRNSHQGLSSDFSNRIADLLRESKAMEDGLRNHTYGAMSPLEQAEARQKDMPSWAHQDPMAEGMGYEWASRDKMKSIGFDDEYIDTLMARHDFHPQEIEHLRDIGALRAPYAEYLAKQEEMRRQAEEQAARERAAQEAAQRSYHSSGGYSGGGGGSSYSAPAPRHSYTPAPQTGPSYMALDGPGGYAPFTKSTNYVDEYRTSDD